MRVAGLISGTSLDGIDVAIVDFGVSMQPIAWRTISYPAEVREELLSVTNKVAHVGKIARLNVIVGELFAKGLIVTCKDADIPLRSIDLVGSHGQTIFHEGRPQLYSGFWVSSTMQIGEPSIIAERIGVPVVSDFRQGDMAAGGQGAPLVPLLDLYLFRDAARTRVALNLGGIANITVIPPEASRENIVAYDTGPSNMILDGLAQREGLAYDRDGDEARRGKVDETLLAELLADPYFERAGPKSAGREQYGEEMVSRFLHLTLSDALATATELTACTIADAIARYPGDKDVIAAGGGVHNTFLMERLASRLGQDVRSSLEWGIPVDVKEAVAFAYLAGCCVEHKISNIASATGARRGVVLGKITNPFPRNGR